MWLTKIPLNKLRKTTQNAYHQVSKLHGAIQSQLPEKATKNLWRVDQTDKGDVLLVLSEESLNTKPIIDQFGYLNGSAETRDYTPLLDAIIDGEKWRFKISANATCCISSGDPNTRGNVREIENNEQKLKEWLKSKALYNGFRLEDDEFQVLRTKLKTYKNGLHFRETTFIGYLTVEDSERFKETLVSGIGRKKAYGQGWLTISR